MRSDDKVNRSSGASLNLKISAEPRCRGGLRPLLQRTAVSIVVDDSTIHILSRVFLNAEYIKVKVVQCAERFRGFFFFGLDFSMLLSSSVENT